MKKKDLSHEYYPRECDVITSALNNNVECRYVDGRVPYFVITVDTEGDSVPAFDVLGINKLAAGATHSNGYKITNSSNVPGWDEPSSTTVSLPAKQVVVSTDALTSDVSHF